MNISAACFMINSSIFDSFPTPKPCRLFRNGSDGNRAGLEDGERPSFDSTLGATTTCGRSAELGADWQVTITSGHHPRVPVGLTGDAIGLDVNLGPCWSCQLLRIVLPAPYVLWGSTCIATQPNVGSTTTHSHRLFDQLLINRQVDPCYSCCRCPFWMMYQKTNQNGDTHSSIIRRGLCKFT